MMTTCPDPDEIGSIVPNFQCQSGSPYMLEQSYDFRGHAVASEQMTVILKFGRMAPAKASVLHFAMLWYGNSSTVLGWRTALPDTNLCGDGDLNLDTSLDVDDDLLDDLGWGVQVDQALVDSEEISLVSLPFSFRTAYPSPISLLLYIL